MKLYDFGRTVLRCDGDYWPLHMLTEHPLNIIEENPESDGFWMLVCPECGWSPDYGPHPDSGTFTRCPQCGADEMIPFDEGVAIQCASCGYMPGLEDDGYSPGRSAWRKTASKSLRNRVGERDGWICHRCELPVSRDRTWPHPLSAVADHYPVTQKNGGKTEASNLRIAHSVCNNPAKDAGEGLAKRLYADPETARYEYTPEEVRIMDQIREKTSQLKAS